MVIFLIGFVLVVVGWELIDSPVLFLAEFGLQVVSASHRVHFSASSIFLFAITARKLYEP
ncbi:MAG: hypothetical protein IPG56_15780 [Caulobacteraceae bacterium]|nr:hypothetical protein [Caulobacteraceae bacterium]